MLFEHGFLTILKISSCLHAQIVAAKTDNFADDFVCVNLVRDYGVVSTL